MPRIPVRNQIVPLRGGPSSVAQAAAPLAIVANQLDRAGEIAFAVEQARTQARREIALNRSLIDFTKGMDDLQLRAEQQSDPDAMRNSWIEDSQRILQETRDSLADPVVQREFEQRAAVLHEQRRVGIERKAWDLTVQSGQATTQERITQLATQAAGARNDIERAQAMAGIQDTIDRAFASGFYKPEEKARAEKFALGQVEKSDLILGATALQNARSSAEVDAISRQMASRIETAQALLPEERARATAGLISDARIAKDRLQTQGDRFRREMAEQSAYKWNDRILGASLENLPSSSEILADKSLTPTQQEHYVELLSQRASGANLNRTDASVANEIWDRIHNPSNPNPISSTAELAPYVGHGLNVDDTEKFRADIKEKENLAEREQKASLAAFLKSAETQITGATALVPATPSRAAKFYDFRFMATQEWEKAKREGVNPVEKLLNPASKDYLGLKIAPYRMTMKEWSDELMTGTEQQPEVPARGEGESLKDYLERTR